MSTPKLKDYDIVDTATRSAEEAFIDVDLTFRVNPLSKDVSVRKGVRAVAQSIRTIIMTNPGDLPNEPEFGVGVERLLGENYDPISLLEFKNNVYSQVQRYEPRAELVDVLTSFENHAIRIRVIFLTLNNPNEEAVDIVVERVL